MLIVNADRTPGEFFRISVSGLCENTSYEFSSWLINLLPSNYSYCGYGTLRPINVSFEIWDSTDTIKLKSGDTGDLYGFVKPKWEQYALLFQTKPGQTSVILKIKNNGIGGCGNDLALDDIVFKPCGDAVVITDELDNQTISVDKNKLPFSTLLTATPDFSVFSSHAYQWQESKDGINWEDIIGATKKRYKIPPINSPRFYRVKIAETINNLTNALCYSNSDYYEVKIIEAKEPSIKKVINKTTYKKVIIVKDRLKIIHDKVWIDGAVGKFVQTGEQIIQQGKDNAIVIVEEITYSKGVYGYNSNTRRYRIVP